MRFNYLFCIVIKPLWNICQIHLIFLSNNFETVQYLSNYSYDQYLYIINHILTKKIHICTPLLKYLIFCSLIKNHFESFKAVKYGNSQSYFKSKIYLKLLLISFIS